MHIVSGKHTSNEHYKSMIQKLRNDLLRNYDKVARPVLDENNTTEISFTLSPIYLSELNEEKQFIKLETWLQLTWYDHHLIWRPDNYSGILLIHFDISEIWKPDLSIYSSLPVNELLPLSITNAICYNIGMVIWVPPVTLTSYCEMDYKEYPNDIQECNITFGSWTHHGLALNLKLSDNKPHLKYFHNTNPNWILIDSSIRKEVNVYPCCPEPYPSIIVTLKFKRSQFSNPQMIIWGTPFIAIFLTLIMFWLPSNLLHKFILGCTSLMILTLMLLYVGWIRSSPIVTLLSARSIHSTMYIVASAMLMEIIIINLGRITGTFRPPSTLTYWLSGIVGKIMLICIPNKGLGTMQKIEENQENEFTVEDYSGEWLIISTALDRICFVIYFLIFIMQKNS